MKRRSPALLSFLCNRSTTGCDRSPTAFRRSVLSAFQLFSLSALLLTALPLSLHAQTVVASDAGLESYFDATYEFQAAGGTSGNHRLFIVGNSSAYNAGLAETGNIYIGGGDNTNGSEYNELIIRNGSNLSLPNNIETLFYKDNNTLTVTGANSEFHLQWSTSAAGFDFASNTTGTVVQALDGGLIQSGRYVIRSNASVTFNVDGADSIIMTRSRLSMDSGSVATINVGNGGTFRTPNFDDTDGTLNLTLNDGGTLYATDSLNIALIDNFTFASGATILMNANKLLSGLGSIDSGRTVDFSAGGNLFGDATTLDGGTLKTAAFDMANLTFTSGTLEASGALTNLPTLSSGLSVDITSGGSFGDATTLNGGSISVAAFDMTNLTFTSGTLTTTGALTNLDATSSGQTVILDGGTWSPSGNIDAGDTTIQNSGSLSVGNLDATNLTFTSGTLTTTGALTNYTSAANQILNLNTNATWDTGDAPTFGGTVNLTGGTLDVQAFDASQLNSFTSGTLNVAGALTNYTNAANQTLNLNSSGSWDAGDNPTFGGTVNLTGGSLSVDSFDADQLASFNSGSLNASGAVSVGANGTSPTWAGDMTDTGSLTKSGTGTLSLSGTNDYSGTTTVSAGTLAVSDGGSISHSGSTLRVGYVDGVEAELTIAAGATVTNGTGTVGQTAGSTGSVDVSGNWVNGGTLYVGNNGTGSLTVQTGAVVSNGDGRVGNSSGSIGSVDVTGTWNNSGFTQIGRYGEGSLNIQSGGLVTNTDGAIAAFSGSGTADVSGTWTNSGELRVGVRGTGTLNLLDGGVLNAADVDGVLVGIYSGSVGTLNLGTGGNTGIVNADQINGGDGTATVNFNHTDTDFHLTTDGTSGGTAVPLTGSLAVNHLGTGTSTLPGTNTYTGGTNITAGTLVASSLGTGTVTINGGNLSVTAAYDATNLTFTNGSLTIAGDASNLPDIVTNNAVTLTGGGTLQTATTLNGGTLTGGNFDLNSNLTFTAGTLNVSGTLQNLSHLPSGTAVNMSGASADLLLSQNLTITGGTLNIDSGASVTVLNDVTLGAGSIGFDSNGGNLDLGGGKLIVAAMDTALALNANASITGNGSIYGDINLATGGTIDGDATGITIFGDVSGTGTLADTTLYGVLNVGNSPGEISLENTTLGSSTVINLAIEGADSSEFDRLLVDANSDISAATINITFESYTPASMGLTYSLVSNSSSTSFANINTPEGWAFNGTTLSAVPEPHTFALLAALLALGFTTTRRRRQKVATSG